MRDIPPGLVPGEHGARRPDVLRGLRLGHIDHVHGGPGHGGDVGLEVRGRQAVHPHDDDLAAGPSRRRLEERLQRRARLGLPRLLDGVLQVEGDGVGVARERLGEELGPRRGHEQLAAHEEIHRGQASAAFAGSTTAARATQPLDLLVGVTEARQDLARVLTQSRRGEGSGRELPGELNRMRHGAVAPRARRARRSRGCPRRPPADGRTCPRPRAPPRTGPARRTAPPTRARCAPERRADPGHDLAGMLRALPHRVEARVAARARAGRSARTAPSRSAACWPRRTGCRASSDAIP